MKPQVDAKHYFNKSYDSKDRFCSYWTQIKEIASFSPKKILDIGIGNGFVSQYLKTRNYNVVTLDIDKNLNPDKTGSVLNIPFRNNCFDVVVCCETLEHLPYKKFRKALSEMRRVSKSYVILSLPDVKKVCKIHIKIPGLKAIKKLIPFPAFKKIHHKFDGQHYWEIGKSEYPLNRIINDINKERFKIQRTYRMFEEPYFRFFILKKYNSIISSSAQQDSGQRKRLEISRQAAYQRG